jgi:hypothetical protein
MCMKVVMIIKCTWRSCALHSPYVISVFVYGNLCTCCCINVVGSDGALVAHGTEDGGWCREQVCWRIKLGNATGVEHTNPVVADDSPKSI